MVKASTAAMISHAHNSSALTLHLPLGFDADVSLLPSIASSSTTVELLLVGSSGEGAAIFFEDANGPGIALIKPFGSRQLHLLGGARLLAANGTDVVAACTSNPAWAAAATSWAAVGVATRSAQSTQLVFSSPSARILFQDAEGASGRSDAVALVFDGTTVRVQGGGLIVGGVDVRSVCTSI